MVPSTSKLLTQAQLLAPELSRLRRDIHIHPELGFQELRTSALVADTLREIGGMRITTGVAKTGVVADLGNDEGPTIAIRADMDALPIIEESAQPYASNSKGVMHACGHDGHTAMLLGVAHLLRQQFAEQNLKGRVRFLFQPSEEMQDTEGKSGGMRMVEENVLDGVDAVIALHVDSNMPFGKVACESGWVSAAADEFEAWITGTGGHGAYPQYGTDPTWMLISVLTAIHGIRARRLSPMDPGVVSIGAIHAGNAGNVIPSEVYLNGTLRSFDPKVREQLIAELEKAVAVAKALGGDYRLNIKRGYVAGFNNATVNSWLSTTASDLMGEDALKKGEKPGMGAEDFSYMSAKVPGAMFMLGAAVGDKPRGHHTPLFDIDERCLPYGTAILAETAVRFLKGEAKL